MGCEGLCVCLVAQSYLFATPWTVAHQAAVSMEFYRQEYWSGLPFSPLGDLPDPGIALAGGFFTSKSPGKTLGAIYPLLI